MNDTLLTTLTTILAILGIGAELNLMRVFIADARSGRRERARRRGATGATIALAALAISPALATAQPQEPPSEPESIAKTALDEQAPKLEGAAAPLVISADRPGFSETTGIVQTWHLQLETGYTYTFRNRDGVETQRNNAPEILARLGVIDDRLELRFSTAGYIWSRTDDGTGGGFVSSEGFSDLSLGFKLKLTDQNGWLPRLAFDITTTLGTGSNSVSNQIAEPAVKLLWSYDLGESFGDAWKGVTLGGNGIAAWPTSNGARFTQGQASVYISFPVCDKTSAFFEYFVLAPNSKGTDAAHYIDFGGAYLLNDRVQLDIRFGLGLNNEADNAFVGGGISFLF